MRNLTAVALGLACGFMPVAAAAAPSDASIRGAFTERCGGCHGVEGRSVSTLVPDLRGQAGYFLCTPEGRAFLPRLPNIAFSGISDARLTDLVNYTVFTLGGASAPSGAKPYTPAEIARLRRDPLTTPDLVAQRRRVTEDVIARCPAATGLRTYKSRPVQAANTGESTP